MNIIEKMREILTNFPKISDICGVNVDFAAAEPTSCGLSSIGDTLIYEDILGNQSRRHSFMLYTTFSGINDFERLNNSSTLQELAVYLTMCKDIPVTTQTLETQAAGMITKITAGNGRIYELPQENVVCGLRYQIQIEAEYTVEF